MTRLWIVVTLTYICACLRNPFIHAALRDHPGNFTEQRHVNHTHLRDLGRVLYQPFLNCSTDSELKVPVGNDAPYVRARDLIGFYKHLMLTNDTTLVNYSNGVGLDAARSLFLAGNLTGAMTLLTKMNKIILDWGPGVLWNPELESLVANITKKLIPPSSGNYHFAQKKAVQIRKVLHVATQFYDTGGHTRVVSSFIEYDTTRRHQIFMTTPLPIPEFMKSFEMTNCSIDVYKCAVSLRRTARKFDLVVLHVHMGDLVPLFAFSTGYRGPPIAFFDHADHMPWVGSSILDAHLTFRDAAHQISERRGIPKYRNVKFTMPVSNKLGVFTKMEARQFLELQQDDVILLSMASSYKFAASTHLLELVLPIIREFSNVKYVVVGAPTSWAALCAAHKVSGQCMFMKNLRDPRSVAAYHTAADVHIDSFPFASILSMLETGLEGGVMLGFCPWTSSAADDLLCSRPTDYGNSHMVSPHLSCRTPESYTDALRKLLLNMTSTRQMQSYTRHSLRVHSGNLWLHQLEIVYQKILDVRRLYPRYS